MGLMLEAIKKAELERLKKLPNNIRNGEWCRMADSCTACNGIQRHTCQRIHELEIELR